MRLTRRSILAGLLASSAEAAWGKAPDRSLRPRPRGEGFYKQAVTPAEEMIARARLGGEVSFVVADAATGQVLESVQPGLPQPPASTAKALTTLYGLDALGPDHRFTTRLYATGPIFNGRVEGDLILAGGGDPTLDTDSLARMVADLKASGLREIGGKLKVWSGALPEIFEIDDEQPDHVGYNPAIGGLNLNYNRVHFEWKRGGGGYDISMGAPAGAYRPEIRLSTMSVVDRAGPIYTFETSQQGSEDWTVARGALGQEGARWLPVRHPAVYAGEVFQSLALAEGIMLGGAVEKAAAVSGQVLVEHQSVPLREILVDMLKYSTNVTAEIVGLSASLAKGHAVPDLAASAAGMNRWLSQEAGLQTISFEDHSGLGDDSRVSAADMVRAMVKAGPEGALRPLLKDFPIYERPELKVEAKTGTLNFVSALTGYLDGPANSTLAFAIFCSNIEKRDALSVEQRERPEGGRAWANSARHLQRKLLERWAVVYSG